MTCKKHKRYKVIRQPRSECPACWEMWIEKDKAIIARKVGFDIADAVYGTFLESLKKDASK